MNLWNIVLLSLSGLCLLGSGLYAWRTNCTIQRLDNLFDEVLSGDFHEHTHDESTLSRLEQKFSRFLHQCKLTSNVVETERARVLRQARGGGHVALKYQTQAQYDTVKTHASIEHISYSRILADSVDNPQLLKRRGEFYYMDETGQTLTFCTPTTGAAPQAKNELMTDTKTLQMLGVPLELGAPVTLELTVHGQRVRRDFVLSGWWEADPVFNVAMLVTSRAYMEAPHYLASNTNWAYLSAGSTFR